jgi:hypothetical protein
VFLKGIRAGAGLVYSAAMAVLMIIFVPVAAGLSCAVLFWKRSSRRVGTPTVALADRTGLLACQRSDRHAEALGRRLRDVVSSGRSQLLSAQPVRHARRGTAVRGHLP